VADDETYVALYLPCLCRCWHVRALKLGAGPICCRRHYGRYPERLNVEQQNERLKEWKDAGVRVIRTGIAPNDKGIDIAKLIYDHGVKIDWMPRFQYRPDAPKRPH
jgi:hypothetical protein